MPKKYNRKKMPLSRNSITIIKISLIFALAILIYSQNSCSLKPSDTSDIARYHNKTFNVIYAVDGDTIDIDIPDLLNNKPKTRLRFIGVDTPETKHPTKKVMHYGPEASAFTKAATLKKLVTIKLNNQQNTRCKYKRLLAYVYIHDQDNKPISDSLNKKLIRLGYGYAYRQYTHPLKDEFIRLEKEAKLHKRGLWKDAKAKDMPNWYN